jgi:predicted RNA methylase
MRAGLSRLHALQRETMEAGREMEGEAQRFARISGAEPTRAISAVNLFQTPEALAARMAALLAGCSGPWLEPSAGLGRLYRAARAVYSGPITLVEMNPDCAGELYRQTRETSSDPGATLRQRDFLTCGVADLGGPFGAVLMNPPFKQGADVKHITHALSMLRPGGTLVALCYNGTKQRRDLESIAGTWEILPGAFTQEGTRAEVALLTITA